MLQLRESAVDGPVAAELLTEYFAMRSDGFPGQYRPALPQRAVFEEPSGVFLVAYDDGHAVGCGGIRAVADGPLGRRDEVKHLYVRPTFRGRGWGRALLDELEHRARDRGAAELVLDTHHTLLAAAGLYASTGFTPIAPYNDNPNATRWYGKALR